MVAVFISSFLCCISVLLGEYQIDVAYHQTSSRRSSAYVLAPLKLICRKCVGRNCVEIHRARSPALSFSTTIHFSFSSFRFLLIQPQGLKQTPLQHHSKLPPSLVVAFRRSCLVVSIFLVARADPLSLSFPSLVSTILNKPYGESTFASPSYAFIRAREIQPAGGRNEEKEWFGLTVR